MTDADVARHYGRSGATQGVLDALVAAGHDLDALELDALAGVDEFHLGGRLATEALLDSLTLGPDVRALDLGCGIGGPARTFAHRLGPGARVTGLDLTPEFVDAARELTTRVGLAGQTRFEVGSALDLDGYGPFDLVTLLHVGMNIADKPLLASAVAGVLAVGGTFAVYDVMRVGDGEITYPVPWASDPSTSFLATEDEYVAAIESAGLRVVGVADRRPVLARFFEQVQQDPPAVNLGHLMGPDWPTMFGNLRTAIQAGTVAPIQIVATAT